MKEYLKKFSDSSKELGKIFSLTICAMMLALRVVLGIFANNLLPFIPFSVVKVSLTFIPIVLTAYLFGPVCTAIVAGAGDVLTYFLAPTPLPYNPGITACYIIEGIIYGVILYHSELTLPRTIMAKVADLILCTLTLQSVIMKIMLFQNLPLTTIIFYRAIVLIPVGVVEVAFIMAMKKPLKLVEKQL